MKALMLPDVHLYLELVSGGITGAEFFIYPSVVNFESVLFVTSVDDDGSVKVKLGWIPHILG